MMASSRDAAAMEMAAGSGGPVEGGMVHGEASARGGDGGGAADRRALLKGGFGLAGSAAALLARPSPSGAFCGLPFPSWAYFVENDDGLLPFAAYGDPNRYSLYIRALGDLTKEKKAGVRPMVVIPGGPGLPQVGGSFSLPTMTHEPSALEPS